MAGSISNDLRDSLATAFREAVAEKYGIVPFTHQRAVWCASEGMTLSDVDDPLGVAVKLQDGTIARKHIYPREAGRARFLADLGAFKIGKSFGAALWASGFAMIPNGRVSLVGMEYDICEPEFNYLCEFLLSEQGMGLKATSVQNRPRDGKMWMDLENGMRYEAKSWERKDSLKGKEIDAYVYCEAYQLPGIECFTGFSQNLRARRGYAYFATTPDRPWIKLLHELGHGGDPEWHCTCSVGAEVNPFTFDATAKVRDEKLMTREKFAIHYGGKMGDFVGRVFNYERGDRLFDAKTHPDLFDANGQLDIPAGWEVVGAADTGTHYSGLLVAFSPSGDAFVLDEFPNYRYVAGLPERDENLTIPEWARTVTERCDQRGARTNFFADRNTQFRGELRAYGINLIPATSGVEERTEVTREYFQHGRVWLSPGLSVLPFELENASWPEESSATGKFARVKDRDHTLDCLEHILARRPMGRVIKKRNSSGTWIEQTFGKFPGKRRFGNVHLGRN